LYRRFVLLQAVAAACLVSAVNPAAAAVTLYKQADQQLDIYGDFRLRLEEDWDSLQGNGTKRDDRLRIRTRVRLGLKGQFDEQWSANVRLRTGSDDSQQSPHITIYDFDGNDNGNADVNFDLWYLQYSGHGFTAWTGRNQLSYWRQDAMLITDDVTFLGIGGSYQHALGKGSLTWNLNLTNAPAGMTATSGKLAFGQVAYDRNFERAAITMAAGYIDINADPDDPSGTILLTENNTRDYGIYILSGQWRRAIYTAQLTIGFDYMHNNKNYADATPGSFSEFHKDDVDGYVGLVTWGKDKAAGDWQLGYYYVYVEALAVNSSYEQDDWVRWGNANQTRASNMKGSEFRVVYTLSSNMNINLRVYIVDAIDLLNPGDTTKEDGNRARIDYNVKF